MSSDKQFLTITCGEIQQEKKMSFILREFYIDEKMTYMKMISYKLINNLDYSS